MAPLTKMIPHPAFLFENSLLQHAVLGDDGSTWVMGILVALYATMLVALSFYGGHRFSLVRRWWSARNSPPATPTAFSAADVPGVTVQLPLFNESSVVERVILAAAAIDWPSERLQIQVLDDSTDETTSIARALVARLKSEGTDIILLHRSDRTGFKAGALEAGLKVAHHPFVAIFDADFVPPTDFLRRTMDHFTDPTVAVVQSRWGHLNENHNLLTRLQALMLDGHFRVEHVARSRHGLFFNFNGTAGIWRKAAIADAGGWHHETLTEDLDLSYRAQLRGWRFVYRDDVVCPAELPESMNAFKTQQHRWAKGSIQVMRKLLTTVLRARQPWSVRKEAFFHLTSNLCYLVAVPVFIFMLPMLMLRARIADGWLGFWLDLGMFLAVTGSVVIFLLATLHARGRKLSSDLLLIPGLLALGTGLAMNQTRAVIEALCGHTSAFVRTPKGRCATGRYLGAKSVILYAEVLGALYSSAVLAYALREGLWTSLPFCGLFFFGYWQVVFGSALETKRSVKPAPTPRLATS
ncbi:MAG: glycosyltransferase [Planctomycetes bacterium]|nr:glycosyltransferase [Planctomycetota bacterium]